MGFEITEMLYWTALGLLVYSYFGFFLLLIIVSKLKSNPVQKREIFPSVSIIICAYNEESSIDNKIKNCLELEYPQDKIEIIIVSDGSTDGTNHILKKMEIPSLRTHFLAERMGKAECQNIGVRMAKNEVIFFTDATIIHPANTLKVLNAKFL